MPTGKSPITAGSRVTFDSGRGTQRGSVLDLLPCLSNGRLHAVVEIEHALPGIVETVPVDELTAIAPGIKFVFSSGDIDALPRQTPERRFWRAKTTDTTGA